MLPCSSSSVVEMEGCADGEVDAHRVKKEVSNYFVKYLAYFVISFTWIWCHVFGQVFCKKLIVSEAWTKKPAL